MCAAYALPFYLSINFLINNLFYQIYHMVVHTHTHTPLIGVRVCTRFFGRNFSNISLFYADLILFIFSLPFPLLFYLSLFFTWLKSYRLDWQYIGMHRCICKRYNAHRHQHIHRQFGHCRPSCDYIMLTTDCGMGRYRNMVCCDSFLLSFSFSQTHRMKKIIE